MVYMAIPDPVIVAEKADWGGGRQSQTNHMAESEGSGSPQTYGEPDRTKQC